MTLSRRLLLLLGLLGCISLLPTRASALEITSLPYLSSYSATPVYGESGPGSILSLAANVTASLQPQTALFLSFALCAVSAEGVQVFVSTSAAFSSPSSADLDPADFDVNGRPRWTSDPDKGVWFIDLAGGYGTWQGGLGANGDGLWIAIRSDNQSVNGDIEVGLSKAGPSRPLPSDAVTRCCADIREV